ncbi:hypothetical protein PV458_42385 [Streptomyces sp. MN03-5084-2B]|nr:hypothetical protein [Streptomyces sp. MN03-5084-2B]
MRKRDGIGGCAVLLVLIAMIVLIVGAVIYGFTFAVTHYGVH